MPEWQEHGWGLGPRAVMVLVGLVILLSIVG